MGSFAAVYGLVRYAVFPASFRHSIGCVVNLVLLGLCAVQHSVMARPACKAAGTRVARSCLAMRR